MVRTIQYIKVSDGDAFSKYCTKILELHYGVKSSPVCVSGDGGKDIIIPTNEGEMFFECKNRERPSG